MEQTMGVESRDLSELNNGGAASLSLRGLSKRFVDEHAAHNQQVGTLAVDNVTLDVVAGEFVTLLGPSGCGKTTTLRMIAGFETPTAGTIHVGDRDITQVPANKRPISMVFQSYALFPHLSVWENVAFGLRLKRLSRRAIGDRVELALVTMNLMNQGNKSPRQLSGGQQQRVALARAMVMQPAVMLFDEPLSNLDAKLRAQMRSEIRTVQRRLGTTAVFVTHDQAEAMTMSDRIVVMNGGKVAQIGTPEQIYMRPNSVFVGDFIGQANFIDVDVISIADGMAEITVFDELIAAPTHPAVKPGDKARLLVRPEALALEEPTDSDSPIRRCTVVSSTYFGGSVEYDLDSAVGPLVATVSAGSEGLMGVLHRGAEVGLKVRPSQTWLLPSSERAE
ncbi:MAG: ABC transporter ATP-binding protein [Nakamurella sp.]